MNNNGALASAAGVSVAGEAKKMASFFSRHLFFLSPTTETPAALANRALKDKFCQKISVQYFTCILCDVCLKPRNFTASVWFINEFTTQLLCIN